jgi:hypothetical protein
MKTKYVIARVKDELEKLTDEEIEKESEGLLQRVEQNTDGWYVVGGIKDLHTTE